MFPTAAFNTPSNDVYCENQEKEISSIVYF